MADNFNGNNIKTIENKLGVIDSQISEGGYILGEIITGTMKSDDNKTFTFDKENQEYHKG